MRFKIPAKYYSRFRVHSKTKKLKKLITWLQCLLRFVTLKAIIIFLQIAEGQVSGLFSQAELNDLKKVSINLLKSVKNMFNNTLVFKTKTTAVRSRYID